MLHPGRGNTQNPPQDNRLSYLSLKRMIIGLGYEPRDLNNDRFEIMVPGDNVKNYIAMNLSKDESNVWFYAFLIELKNPEQVPARTWLDLMKENARIGPNVFGYDEAAKRLYLYRPVTNHDLTPEKMRAAINNFVQNLRATAPLWADNRFVPGN
jgi:hypothetical protein